MLNFKMLKINKKILKKSLIFSDNLNLLQKYSTKPNNEAKKLHEPVMLNEVIKHLVDEPNNFKVYLDMTFGAGGHSEAILKSNPNSVIYASDRDPFAFELANEMSKKYPGRIFPMNGKFSELGTMLQKYNVTENSIDGALIDCGVSSIQFDTPDRGFSISREGPLDMRMGSSIDDNSVSAEDVVNKLGEEHLGKIIWKYGEERMYKKIAHGIVYFRSAHGPIKTTKQLAEVIASTVSERRTDSLNRPTHVATKTFQALRIFVNNELNEIYNGINEIYRFLRPGGRLAVITFHSLEDRIVKSQFHDVNLNLNESENELESEKISKKSKINKKTMKFKMNNAQPDLEMFNDLVKHIWQPLNKKVILPTDDEISSNPRARSAKLRVAIKN